MQGRTLKRGVRLRARGTLSAFVPEFRREEGPFQTALEDAQGRRLADLTPLREWQSAVSPVGSWSGRATRMVAYVRLRELRVSVVNSSG